MTEQGASRPPGWQEEDTQTFLDLARYAVPNREAQIDALAMLIPATEEPFDVIDVCCGEGLLSAAILERYPQAWVTGLDGSAAMLEQAKERCARFGVRFTAKRWNLESGWSQPTRAPLAVVSSLALHHLDHDDKRRLYREVHASLSPGGAFLIADLVQPASKEGHAYATDAWDDAVRERARGLDGNERGFEAFTAAGWNLYRHPDPEVDKPAPVFHHLCWLTEAGFNAVDVFWMRAGHALFGGRRA